MRNSTFYEIEQDIYYSRFRDALAKLEELPVDSQSTYYFHILEGITYFKLVNIDKAYRSFRNALEYNENDVLCKLYLACIHLKSMKVELAIKQWMGVLEVDEKNKHVLKAFSYLKNLKRENLSLLSKNPYKKNLLPPFVPERIKQKFKIKLLLVGLLLVPVALLIPFYPVLYQRVTSILKPENERTKLLETIKINDASTRATENEITDHALQEILQFPVKISLDPKKVRSIISDIEGNFIRFKENESRVLINSILNSDASIEDKQRVYVIQQNLTKQSFLSDLRWFLFDEMKAELWKFHNVLVKWKGTVSRVQRLDRNNTLGLEKISQTFAGYAEVLRADFLLDFYAQNKTLQAVIPVYFTPELKLQDGNEVELLAFVKYNEASIDSLADFVNPESNILLYAIEFRYILP